MTTFHKHSMRVVATERSKAHHELTRDGPTSGERCGNRELPSLVSPVVGPSFQAAHQRLQELFWTLQKADAGSQPTLRCRLFSGPLRRSVRHAHEGYLSLGSCGHLRQFDKGTVYEAFMKSRHGTKRGLSLASTAERWTGW